MSTTIWNIDPTHSEVQFKVKHLVISTVTGQFNEFSGKIEADGENFDGAKASFEADINSVDTNNNDRDTHLKSGDFFDAEKHPKLEFKNGTLKKKSDEEYTLEGDMTIKGHTQKITLSVDLGGIMDDPYGNRKAGFEITGKIKRKEFGLTWNAVTEAGGVVVGDEIKLILNVQVAKA